MFGKELSSYLFIFTIEQCLHLIKTKRQERNMATVQGNDGSLSMGGEGRREGGGIYHGATAIMSSFADISFFPPKSFIL